MHWVQKVPSAVCSQHQTCPLQRAGRQLSKQRWRQKQRTKLRRRRFPPASNELWKDLTEVLGTALCLQKKLKQEPLAQQLSSTKLQVAQQQRPHAHRAGCPTRSRNRDARQVPPGRAAAERCKHLLAGGTEYLAAVQTTASSIFLVKQHPGLQSKLRAIFS